MGWFSSDHDNAKAYDQVQSGHKGSITHDLIAGAAAYEAAKAYENHCAKNGQPATHQEAMELLAGFSGAFVDHLVSTKGLDFIDKEKAKRDAQKQTEKQVASDYGQ